MRKILLGLCFLFSIYSFAQTPIYWEEFDGSLGEWTTNSVDCEGSASTQALWKYTADGTGNGAYTGNIVINSITRNNGAAIFDSDFLDNNGNTGESNLGTGNCPAPHTGELISPTFDFTDESSVVFTFYQSYVRFAGYPVDGERNIDDPATIVGISTDGGQTWEEVFVNEDAEFQEIITRKQRVVSLDFSDELAGESNVKFKFKFSGDYYYWTVDDVRIFNTSEFLDLELKNYYYPLNNYNTPVSQIDQDTMHVFFSIKNNGAIASDSLRTTFEVIQLDDNNNRLGTEFIDSLDIDGLDPDEEREIYYENSRFVPVLNEGRYAIIFSVFEKADSLTERVNLDNNSFILRFNVTDSEYEKSEFESTGLSYEAEALWTTFYNINPNYLEPLIINEIEFGTTLNGGVPKSELEGKNLVGYVLEIADTVTSDLNNLQFGSNMPKYSTNSDQNGSDKKLVGIGSKTFDFADTQSNDDFYTMQVIDFENTDELGVMVQPGKKYMVGVEYPANTELFQQVDYDINYAFEGMFNFLENGNIELKDYPFATFSSVPWVYIDGWFGIFGVRVSEDSTDYSRTVAPLIGVNLSLGTTVDEKPLPEYAVKAFPNPARDFVNVEIQLEKPQTINVFLADITGRIVDEYVKQNFDKGIVDFQTSHLTSGTYFVRIVTEEGTKTKKINIQ